MSIYPPATMTMFISFESVHAKADLAQFITFLNDTCPSTVTYRTVLKTLLLWLSAPPPINKQASLDTVNTLQRCKFSKLAIFSTGFPILTRYRWDFWNRKKQFSSIDGYFGYTLLCSLVGSQIISISLSEDVKVLSLSYISFSSKKAISTSWSIFI